MFNLERVDVNIRIKEFLAATCAPPDEERWRLGHRLTGEQIEWGYNIPWLYHALASPKSPNRFARVPERSDEIPGGVTAYWGSLLHLLVYQFGWSRPDVGLRWWYDAGKPTDDPRLTLLSEVWDRDGQLEWFAAWLWTANREYLSMRTDTGRLRGPGVRVSPEWRAGVDRDIEHAARRGVGNPLTGGWDSLHLSTHIAGPLSEFGGSEQISLSLDPEGGPTGVLMTDRMTGWYARLLDLPALSTPHPSGRSWRIDVVARPVGWLGTFRRSRETGLWFTGRHGFHIVGNP